MPGRRPVLEALAAGRAVSEVHVDPGADVTAIAERARSMGITVRTAAPRDLDRLAGGVRHQGVVAVLPTFATVHLDRLLGRRLVVVLDGVTDPQNLGAIARSAEAAGAAGLVIRERRAAGVTPAAEKAAAGALSWLPVAVVTNIARALDEITDAGAWSVGLDGDAQATVWESQLLDGDIAVVIGAEGAGLSRLVRDRVDELVRIPMAGRIASLNASAAAAVTLFEVARRAAGR